MTFRYEMFICNACFAEGVITSMTEEEYYEAYEEDGEDLCEHGSTYLFQDERMVIQK